ncbi:DNA repair protein RecO [Mesomycoplasma ovipneumoniae]
MAEKIIKGIVVERFDFRDFDLIVKLVTNFGILKMVALGVRQPTSKNIYILNPGCLGEFEIFLAKNPNKLSKLKKGECLVRLDLTNENIYKFWKIIYQFSYENNYDPKIFNIFESGFSKINDKNVDAIIVYVIINWIKINGWISNLTSCKVCKTNKRLVNFDFYGGMECVYHRTLKPFFRFNVKELEILYWANFSLDEYLEKINFDHVYSIFEILKMFLKKNSYIIF